MAIHVLIMKLTSKQLFCYNEKSFFLNKYVHATSQENHQGELQWYKLHYFHVCTCPIITWITKNIP